MSKNQKQKNQAVNASPKQANKHDEGPITNLYIFTPTLEQLLNACLNLKQLAFKIGADCSNFQRQCKMENNMGIETISKCADAFDMDVLILLLPQGLIDDTVPSKREKKKSYQTIHRKNLTCLLDRLCEEQSFQVASFLSRVLMKCLQTDYDNDKKASLAILFTDLTKLLDEYGNKQ